MFLKGTKIVEVPYFINQLTDNTKSVLIIGERHGGKEGVSESVKALKFKNVTTTDINPSPKDSWLKLNTNWKHITSDFIEFDESLKFDYIISISVFEHFGLWFAGDRMANGLIQDDTCRWNHDILGINKACKLLKDKDSKLIITLPAGPFLNYETTGEPFLRGYDALRQSIIKKQLEYNGYQIDNEKFFYSKDWENWDEVSSEINDPSYYPYYSSFSPNVIWGLTIKLK
jgi:hypothetical protein